LNIKEQKRTYFDSGIQKIFFVPAFRFFEPD
jgi:hypothetical protein